MAQLQGTGITGSINIPTASISGYIAVGANAILTPAANEILIINTSQSSTYNIATFKAALNNYTQINAQNLFAGATASTDYVVTNDIGSETTNYIDFGINSSLYTQLGNVGAANDAYLYSLSNKLFIGNASTGSSGNIYFFAGGLDSSANTKMFISSSGQVGIGTTTPTVALEVIGTISASLFQGTSSYASTASLAYSTALIAPAPISGAFGRSSWFIPGAVNGTALTTTAMTTNTCYYVPFIAPYVGTASLRMMGVSVTAGGTAISAISMSIALYDNVAGDVYPRSLIFSGSTITASANTIASTNPTVATFIPGQIYWVAINTNSGSTVRTIPVAAQGTLMGNDTIGTTPPSAYSSASSWGVGTAYKPAWVLSATGSNLTVTTNLAVPAIGFRYN